MENDANFLKVMDNTYADAAAKAKRIDPAFTWSLGFDAPNRTWRPYRHLVADRACRKGTQHRNDARRETLLANW